MVSRPLARMPRRQQPAETQAQLSAAVASPARSPKRTQRSTRIQRSVAYESFRTRVQARGDVHKLRIRSMRRAGRTCTKSGAAASTTDAARFDLRPSPATGGATSQRPIAMGSPAASTSTSRCRTAPGVAACGCYHPQGCPAAFSNMPIFPTAPGDDSNGASTDQLEPLSPRTRPQHMCRRDPRVQGHSGAGQSEKGRRGPVDACSG